MKWSREEYIELLTFGKAERPMFVELFGPLQGLDDEWRSQGASEDEISLSAFDWDYVPVIGCGGSTGQMHGFEPVIIEDTPEYTIAKDSLGRITKLIKSSATISLPLDYPVTDMDSWLKIKHMYCFDESRINWDEVEKARAEQSCGSLVCAGIQGGFDLPRQLMGEENACICYYENPELMHDILNTLSDTSLRVLDRVSDKLVIDNLCVHEDLAGKSGPLVGPNMIEEFIRPYYRSVWDMLFSKGTRLFSQDSDGNMNSVISAFLDCGVNVMFPAEPAAGMDIVEMRKKYGNKLAFKGGIDKHVLRGTKNDIIKELEYKLQPLTRQSGTVFGLDHRITNGTPIENYRFYVNTAREILGLPPISPNGHEHVRMAF